MSILKKSPKLGQQARDTVTGYEGILIAEHEYVHGCKRWGIQAPMKADGTIPEDRLVDEPQLEVTKTKRVIVARAAKKFVKLGDEARDTVSGFKGIVMGRATFINGCHRTGLYPKIDEKGKHVDSQWFDEPQLRTIKKVPVKRETNSGGPSPLRRDVGHKKNVR